MLLISSYYLFVTPPSWVFVQNKCYVVLLSAHWTIWFLVIKIIQAIIIQISLELRNRKTEAYTLVWNVILSIFEIPYEFLVYHENEFGNSKLTRLNFNWVCACTSTSFIKVRCKYSMNIKPELLWIIIILQMKNLWTIKKFCVINMFQINCCLILQ